MIEVKTFPDKTDVYLAGEFRELFTDTWRIIHGIYIAINDVDPEAASLYKKLMLKSMQDGWIIDSTFTIEAAEGGDSDA